jgi:hypothetical protein
MVYYIRFLSGPIHRNDAVHGTLAIATDLRERLLQQDVSILLSAFFTDKSPNTARIQWKAGMFALKFNISAPKVPTRVEASVQTLNWPGPIPLIIPVCGFCSNLDTFHRIFPFGHKRLTLMEWKRESIEGHIW